MSSPEIITEEFIRSSAANTSAVSNGKKISNSGDFVKLSRSEDNSLIFGECKGSGKNPYYTSVDFSGDNPVFRCSCPSRQIPCKHCLGLMFDWLAKKTFDVQDIPEDILRKREKIAKKEENKTSPEAIEKKKKSNKSAVTKKLKKQLEGLNLVENFVNDIFERGISSVNATSSAQYESLAKQIGDYYLPEPQTIIKQIINSAKTISSNPNDNEINKIVSLCVRLSSTIKKSREYINSKLESGEVLPEDNILYEAMGGIWKLTQLKELGLFKENAEIIQLSFTVLFDEIHKSEVDFAYWIDIDSGEISKTLNIRPLKAMNHIKEEDSVFGLHKIKELCHYPGGINKRIRWDSAEICQPDSSIYKIIMSKAENSIGDAVKKAKNELKNTLSKDATAMLIPFDSIEFAVNSDDNHCILKYKSETITLKSNENYPDTANVVSILGNDMLNNGTMLGEIFYDAETRKIYLCPVSIINENGIIRLC